MGMNAIYAQLDPFMKLAVYAPLSYILPSRMRKYEDLYDTEVEGGKGRLRQADRERSLQALMTTNLAETPRMHIPGYPPTYSDNIRPFVPGYPPSFDALP